VALLGPGKTGQAGHRGGTSTLRSFPDSAEALEVLPTGLAHLGLCLVLF
jgi:hypothetical protein